QTPGAVAEDRLAPKAEISFLGPGRRRLIGIISFCLPSPSPLHMRCIARRRHISCALHMRCIFLVFPPCVSGAPEALSFVPGVDSLIANHSMIEAAVAAFDKPAERDIAHRFPIGNIGPGAMQVVIVGE